MFIKQNKSLNYLLLFIFIANRFIIIVNLEINFIRYFYFYFLKINKLYN